MHLEQIIKDAKRQLILISPYLRINNRLRLALEDQDRFKIDIRVIYGKNDLQAEENNWLRSLSSIKASFVEHLHAKCYLNESEALVTSMNLYEFSQQHNEEMGILVRKEDDVDLYEKIYEEASRLIRSSKEYLIEVKEVKQESKPAAKPKSGTKKPAPKKDSAATAHCVRCNTLIPFSMDRPLCDTHHKSWGRYKNPDYPEKYCHSCGKERDTTVGKPMCSDHDKPWFRKKSS
jgi:phosphatidylserine/phosphatidylglycerophosphate/cardiolipin synthase-like enzyme